VSHAMPPNPVRGRSGRDSKSGPSRNQFPSGDRRDGNRTHEASAFPLSSRAQAFPSQPVPCPSRDWHQFPSVRPPLPRGPGRELNCSKHGRRARALCLGLWRAPLRSLATRRAADARTHRPPAGDGSLAFARAAVVHALSVLEMDRGGLHVHGRAYEAARYLGEERKPHLRFRRAAACPNATRTIERERDRSRSVALNRTRSRSRRVVPADSGPRGNHGNHGPRSHRRAGARPVRPSGSMRVKT
jgi:hypothetical protein